MLLLSIGLAKSTAYTVTVFIDSGKMGSGQKCNEGQESVSASYIFYFSMFAFGLEP